MQYLAVTLALVFLGLSLLHGYWALGGKAGLVATLPAHASGQLVYRPPLALVWVVAGGLLLPALLHAAYLRPGWGLTPTAWRWAEGLLAAGLLLRAVGDFRYVGLSKRVRTTLFARLDTRYYTPICLLLAGGCAVLAVVG